MLRELVGTYQVIKGTEYLFTPRPAKWWANAPAAAVMWRNCKKASSARQNPANLPSGKTTNGGQPRKSSLPRLVTALLKDGRARITGCYSEKTGKTYDATVVLEDDGRYANFKLEFDQQKGGKR